MEPKSSNLVSQPTLQNNDKEGEEGVNKRFYGDHKEEAEDADSADEEPTGVENGAFGVILYIIASLLIFSRVTCW